MLRGLASQMSQIDGLGNDGKQLKDLAGEDSDGKI